MIFNENISLAIEYKKYYIWKNQILNENEFKYQLWDDKIPNDIWVHFIEMVISKIIVSIINNFCHCFNKHKNLLSTQMY